jgi:hypothetical protein
MTRDNATETQAVELTADELRAVSAGTRQSLSATTADPTAAKADPLPVLMVVADQQDFYYQDY